MIGEVSELELSASGTKPPTRRRSARLRGWKMLITAKATRQPPRQATSSAPIQEWMKSENREVDDAELGADADSAGVW